MKEITPTITDLIEAGAHFGHLKARSHPRARKFAFEIRERIIIIDLDKTINHFNRAADFLKESAKENKKILFVGTKKQAQQAVRAVADSCKMPYVNTKWLAGTLTNFDEISKNLRKLSSLEDKYKQESDSTKRERTKLQDSIDKLHRILDGIVSLTKLPDVVVVVDAYHEKTAVNEARKLGIPIVAIADTNVDPQTIDFPIPANDDSLKSIEIILGSLGKAILEGLNKTVAKPKKES